MSAGSDVQSPAPVAPSNPYDEVPYTSRPYADTRPDHLRCLGRLFGLEPAPAHRCRVLEIGCASGGNLIPLAATAPGSQFVGLDASAVQIELGQREVEAQGLTNITLRAVDVRALPDDLGVFDYILCHGVWSWVPPDAQQAIFAIVRAHLAPHGIAYVSYNVLPGWYQRMFVRDLARFHGRGFPDPRERVGQARAALRFLADSVSDSDGPYALLARGLNAQIERVTDDYLLHEYLAAHNEPVLFLDFMARAQAQGLQYLAEAEFSTMVPAAFSPEVAETLHRIAPDLLSTEQYLDFLRNRSFRKTLLVHEERDIRRTLSWASLPSFRVASALRAEGEVDPSSREPAAFVSEDGATLTVDEPLLKAAWLLLGLACPASLQFDELVAQARRLADGASSPGAPRPGDREELGAALLTALGAGLLELSLEPDAFAATPGPHPLAPEFARRQAGVDQVVTTLRHRVAVLGPLDRRLVTLLDGTRDLPALRLALQGLAATEPWESEDASQQMLGEADGEARLHKRLAELARIGLLVPTPG